ncbi:hypothetical protein C8T65DRAFT_683213 [Cerioporus squamosus]|nr:hypothetical protein C8T65DRAFT_683213 [Cerioporus squamosus]
MRLPERRAFGPWGGFTPPFGWGIGGATSTTAKTTSITNPPATQTQTQTQIQTSVITSVTDITSVASATVVTTIINPTPTTPPASPTSPASSATGSGSLSSHPTSASSAADHDASSTTGSDTGASSVAYVTLSLSGSTVTLLSTFGSQSRPTIAANAAQPGGQRGMSKGEIAALIVACISVFALSLILYYVWRRRRRVRMAERDIHSPAHTISNGMVQAPHSDRPAGAIAFGGTRGSVSTSPNNSVMPSHFSTSDEGHESVTAERMPSVSGGRTLIGVSPANEKSSTISRSSTSSPSPEGETLRPSTLLLHPQPSTPSQPPPSHLTPPPRTASASPRLLPVPPVSPLMAPGPPGLHGQTPVSASPYAPYAYAWAVQSPTTAASEYSPYAWDNPPPSSEYLPQPGSSRRTTFARQFRVSREEGAGVPPYPSSPGFGEDGRSERSAPPMYTPSSE